MLLKLSDVRLNLSTYNIDNLVSCIGFGLLNVLLIFLLLMKWESICVLVTFNLGETSFNSLNFHHICNYSLTVKKFLILCIKLSIFCNVTPLISV